MCMCVYGCRHTKAIAHVDRRRSALQDTKSLNDGRRHPVLRLVDAEVGEGALRLRTPVLVGRHLDLAERIALDSRVGCHPYRTAVEESPLLDRGVCRTCCDG